MNRKLIALFAAGLSCGTLFADDVVAGEDGTAGKAQTFCRITIDSHRKETVLAIPLTTANGNDTFDVNKFVLTTNLKAGDKLGMRVDGKWAYWTLDADGGTWTPATVSQENNNGVSVTGKTLSVGDCIRLTRCGKNTDLSEPFYLYGLIPTITSKSQTANAGEWTMLANPLPQETTISEFSAKISGGAVKGDKIYLSDGESGIIAYSYNVFSDGTASWGYWDWDNAVRVNGVLSPDWINAGSITIPAGEGFFFISKLDNRTINWVQTQQ